MTSLHLTRRGHKVTLIDRWEPGHGRAASSDYHRIFRSIHGKDEFYTLWVREARLRWMELQEEIGQQLYVENGTVVLAAKGHTGWEDATIPTFDKLGVPYFKFGIDELRIRLPHIDLQKVAYGLWEPEAGFIFAHRAVTETVKLFQREGGSLIRGRVTTDENETPMFDGKRIEADLIVMTTGSWLNSLFPATTRAITRVVRQDVVYTSTPDGDTRFDADNMPCWIDHGYGAYGIPNVNGHGFKAAIAWHHSDIDLDNEDRVIGEATKARCRQYLHWRFPALVGQTVVDQKVCQIDMTPDTHFIIDWHPKHENVLLVGGCSGHLFKHGPVLGDYVAGVGLKEFSVADRFSIKGRNSLSLGDSPSGR